MKSLNRQFSNYNKTVEKKKTQYSALLGMSETVIEHPTRPGFCYARMADNLSELIVVFNDKVSQAYNLPVLVERKGQVWIVVGRDTARYSNWGTSVPFLPKHAEQHEFNREAGTGADTVFVYPDQFMPLLCYPSGTLGSGNILVAPYILQTTNDFLYVGDTGTRNVLIYKPTNGNAIMGLVYLDKTTGNPDVLIASGTPFSNSITGTSQIAQYIPYPSSNQEPLYAFRLVSGTASILWENLYNARQFIGGGFSTGSSGGGGSSTGTSVPLFITGSVPFSGADGILTEDNPHLFWNNTDDQLWVGEHPPTNLHNSVIPLVVTAPTQSGARIGVFNWGTGTSGSPAPLFNGYRARGTLSSLLPVQSGDALISVIGAGFDGASFLNGGRFRVYADADWITGTSTPGRFDFDVTPSGTTSVVNKMSLSGMNFDVHNSPAFTKEITPTIVSSQNDYSPSGLEDAFLVNILVTGGSWDITGLAGGRAGRLIMIRNRGSTRFTLKNNSSSSSSTNRFSLPLAKDVTFAENESILLRYNGNNLQWEASYNGVIGLSSSVTGNLVSFADSSGKVLYDIGRPTRVIAGAIITGTYKAVPAGTDKFGYADSTGTLLYNTNWSDIQTIFNGAYQATGTVGPPGVPGATGSTGRPGGASVVLFDHYVDAGNGTTVETDLYSDTLAANQLVNNGDKIQAEYGGGYVSSATATRQIKLKFAGTTIFDTGALTLSLSSAWEMEVLIIRVSATVIRYSISFATQGAALSSYTASGELTGLTLSNTNILKITGQAAGVGAATNDIVAKLGTVIFVKLTDPSQLFNDAEGFPSPVAFTGSYGTSTYASRRDHVHAGTVVLYDNTLLTTGSFNIPNIPAGFAVLKLVYYLRNSSTGADFPIYFNGDTGANYNLLKVTIPAAGLTAADTIPSTGIIVVASPSTDVAGYFTSGEMTIANYDGTVGYKTIQAVTSRPASDVAGSQRLFNYHGLWKNTAAINRITFTPPAANSFIAGSRVTLIGFK